MLAATCLRFDADTQILIIFRIDAADAMLPPLLPLCYLRFADAFAA